MASASVRANPRARSAAASATTAKPCYEFALYYDA